jgi:hypothetical protein
MKKYNFPHPLQDTAGDIDEYERAMRQARSLQYTLESLDGNSMNYVIGTLNEMKAQHTWFKFPKGNPVKTPRGLLELVTGKPADDVIHAFKTIGETSFKFIKWIEDPEWQDEDFIRNQHIRAERRTGKTQQQIADEVGLSQNRVSEILSVKPAHTAKTDKPRIQVCVYLNADRRRGRTEPTASRSDIRSKTCNDSKNF